MFSENIYINTNLKNKFDSSDIKTDVKGSPQKKTSSHENCHRFSRVLFTALTIYFLLSTILFSTALITLFKKYSQLLEEKAIRKELNYTQLECTKQHSLLKDKVWSCCPKDWKAFSSHCYFISNDLANWNQSEEKCSSMGAHLMVVHSKEEQDFITKILSNRDAYFIGLLDPGNRKWRWVDQTPYNESATFWHRGEPNNDKEQCVIFNRLSGWGWNDVFCSDPQKSVCQMKKIYL
ncbi:C-type lectin domain family 4 member A isoform X1 [Cricetulus griseus]|nr:C-type lectin domain family 4 member A isoform X1 [Cricetulus griseus]